MACADYLGDVYGARVLILAGSGDNGGDALVGRRSAGRVVESRCTPSRWVTPCTSRERPRLRAAGGRIVAEPDWGSYDLAIDGIVGIGGPAGTCRTGLPTAVDALDCPVVAVDVPERHRRRLRGAPRAARARRPDRDVRYPQDRISWPTRQPKQQEWSSSIDIGLGPHLGEPVVEVLQADDVAGLLPVPEHGAHKYSRGVLGIAAGSEEYVGAGLLATSAAVQSGFAGMVRYEGASEDLIRLRHPEVVIGPGQVQAWVVGPGLGDGQGSLVGKILAEGVATVVDADGLRYLPLQCTGPTVLTPHAGELARMLEADRGEVEAKMLSAATAAARRWRAVVLLKGPRSVIASPDGRVRVNTTGVPWLGDGWCRRRAVRRDRLAAGSRCSSRSTQRRPVPGCMALPLDSPRPADRSPPAT